VFSLFQQTAKAIASEAMVRKSGGRLKFSVKGNRAFTHNIEIGQWKNEVKEFRGGIAPFLREGVLLSVLLQFPQSFHYEDETRRYLGELVAEFGDVPLVAEFRHDSWQRQSVYDGLAERNVGWCMCDMPDIGRLPSFAPIVAGGAAYLRFHGRNRKNWYSTNATERYDYLYDDGELAAYKGIIASIMKNAKLVQIYFNNHAKGNAAVNARKMAALLGDCGI
jgi:uncharacterized protein YecE (DUF72 family)